MNPLYPSNYFPCPTGQGKQSGYVVLSSLKELTQNLCSVAESLLYIPENCTVGLAWEGKDTKPKMK